MAYWNARRHVACETPARSQGLASTPPAISTTSPPDARDGGPDEYSADESGLPVNRSALATLATWRSVSVGWNGWWSIGRPPRTGERYACGETSCPQPRPRSADRSG